MTTALATHGDKLTCFTAALASALVARGVNRWWRPLLAGGPTLAVSPAEDDLLLFEHDGTPPLPALGLRVNGADDWATAYHALEEQVAEHGSVVLLADIFHLPWQRGHQRWHAPHWLAIVETIDGWLVEDPLTMTTELGPQTGQRVPVLSAAELRGWSTGLGAGDTVALLREQAMAGSRDIHIGRTYRWLEAQPSEPSPPREGRLVGADALVALASRYQFASTPDDFTQLDDLWQALRQRELLLWAAEFDPEVLDAAGRDHWERAVAQWRKLPPLLMHARMRAAAGGTVQTGLIAETLLSLAEYEGKHLAFAHNPHVAGE
ncbi:BtrH N-terminal domain-containing protein [Nocardia iowensis]|uniref:BtrH N-terminal domain-containing protein n=1 Tax=Nocardia iowensis TaxID=204891 RepID=A0ABX8S2Q7_NOCIO|nr:BtrH N-terminal domain-containing protein [Nocardia iowensis]QXN94910.1 BtrH N-terminal domain-containing protein [Nocardia iowensis]